MWLEEQLTHDFVICKLAILLNVCVCEELGLFCPDKVIINTLFGSSRSAAILPLCGRLITAVL